MHMQKSNFCLNVVWLPAKADDGLYIKLTFYLNVLSFEALRPLESMNNESIQATASLLRPLLVVIYTVMRTVLSSWNSYSESSLYFLPSQVTRVAGLTEYAAVMTTSTIPMITSKPES